MESKEKLRERISLLTRFFWLDNLFKIGKELKLSYFDGFNAYYQMNQYQAATEIATKIDDNKLFEIIKKFVPNYDLNNLGGFHGKFYTATENGELYLKDSTSFIRKNTREALIKWEDKAYGVLQALINRDGAATYFDLIYEIEKVLGYDFFPSFLLPRLKPLNLVYKTGSRKYSTWTIPSEIISAIEKELREFKRPSHPIRPKMSPSENLLKTEIEVNILVDEIIQSRYNTNIIFEKKFGSKLFKQNEMATNDIRKPCSNEEEFNNRVMVLALLIGEVEAGNLKKLIKSEKANGSINLIEKFLEINFPNYDVIVIENLRKIMALRSKKYPVHPGNPDFISALNYFGFTSIPPDWQELWETILSKYLDSLKGFITLLSK